MARRCPIYGSTVLYLDCLECEEKMCRGGKEMQKEYFDKVNTLMQKRGYTCGVIKNPHCDDESRCYSQEPRLDGKENKVIVEVGSNKRFKFFYTNLRMCAKLQTDWMSPLTSREHFDRMLDKFLRSVRALREEWGDW